MVLRGKTVTVIWKVEKEEDEAENGKWLPQIRTK